MKESNEEWKTEKRKYLTARGLFGSKLDSHEVDLAFNDIDQRLIELEEKVLKTAKKPDIDRQGKIVLLLELGVIDYLFTLNISQKKLSKILSLLLNASATNIETDLSDRFNRESYLKSEKNYAFLVKTFKELKLENYHNQSQKVLNEIEKQKEKR